MNLVVLTGRLTRDPELKYGQSGKAYAKFSLAVNRKDETDFYNCTAFGKTAELVGEYLRKGRKVGVQGNIQQNKYEVNGEKRTSYDVIVNSLEFLESKGGTSENYPANDFPGDHAADSKAEAPLPDKDDEFPF